MSVEIRAVDGTSLRKRGMTARGYQRNRLAASKFFPRFHKSIAVALFVERTALRGVQSATTTNESG
jgi:hypothetical protein